MRESRDLSLNLPVALKPAGCVRGRAVKGEIGREDRWMADMRDDEQQTGCEFDCAARANLKLRICLRSDGRHYLLRSQMEEIEACNKFYLNQNRDARCKRTESTAMKVRFASLRTSYSFRKPNLHTDIWSWRRRPRLAPVPNNEISQVISKCKG